MGLGHSSDNNERLTKNLLSLTLNGYHIYALKTPLQIVEAIVIFHSYSSVLKTEEEKSRNCRIFPMSMFYQSGVYVLCRHVIGIHHIDANRVFE